MRNSLFAFVCLFFTSINEIFSLDNGLALTPPMGWLTWERYRCTTNCRDYPDDCISDNLIRKQADKMVSDGYLKAGYNYIIIDDCWSNTTRDVNDRLQPDNERFPYGIKSLSDYVHSKGLKLGIYADYGTKTCAGYPGSIDFLELDAQTFASWEIDYLKLDGCYANISFFDEGYPQMSKYLNNTKRPIVFSCSWPAYQVFRNITPNYEKISNYCNLWRNYGDIEDSFSSVLSIKDWYKENNELLSKYHGIGHWNDPDMLIIGNFGLTVDEAKYQMALWSIMAAPLLISADLTRMLPVYREILLNANLISVNQDPLGKMAKLIYESDEIDIWSKSLVGNKIAVLITRQSYRQLPSNQCILLSQIEVDVKFAYSINDIFTNESLGIKTYADSLCYYMNPRSAWGFIATPVL